VSALAATLALFGIRFTATRLVAMELGRGSADGAEKSVRRCLLYALCTGCAAACSLWLGADLISERWIGDERAALSLRILAFSLPAFALSSVLSGYFTAVGRVVKPAMAQAAEQAVRVAAIAFALPRIGGGDAGISCAVVIAGGVAGEFVSLFILLYMYARDIRVPTGADEPAESAPTRRMFSIAVPLGLSACARVTLSTVQNLLVPRGLRKSGATSQSALAGYGMIQGMVFPVITFPSVLFFSLSELLVPELTHAQQRGRGEIISTLADYTLRFGALFSMCVAAVIFRFAGELGMALYDSAQAGYYIRALSPLIPVIYLDSVTDGMLRGLGQQMHSMRYSIYDSLLSLALILWLLPRGALNGYVFMIYFTSAFNFALSLRKLVKVTRLRVNLKPLMLSAVCAIGSCEIAVLLLRVSPFTASSAGLGAAAHITLAVAVYALFLLMLGCISPEDIKKIKSMLRPQSVLP
jgi:stage V sporulation protein B